MGQKIELSYIFLLFFRYLLKWTLYGNRTLVLFSISSATSLY